ncbi:hypothetical protein TrVE_jg2003 [Triparma verrucosa]|uniref:Uncharacterized protein n=1 Tax=Triparma verrucosa TaxID=1606542 RepID=A0A9W7EW20_9STRA|nr:hypothetical protein TrVE_jg2003 [Triparma verrucosa]
MKLKVLDLKSEFGHKRKARGPITTLSFNAIQPLISSMLSGNKGVPSLEVVNLRLQNGGGIKDDSWDKPWNKVMKQLRDDIC